MPEHCPQCGVRRGSNERFCGTCGQPGPQEEDTMPTATTGDDSDVLRTVLSGTPAPPPLPGPPPPPLPPHTTSARRRRAAIPLVDTFRFVHEPINELNSERFIGRQAELGAFVERVRFSDGGSFLVTGYRGVGKTSFIN